MNTHSSSSTFQSPLPSYLKIVSPLGVMAGITTVHAGNLKEPSGFEALWTHLHPKGAKALIRPRQNHTILQDSITEATEGPLVLPQTVDSLCTSLPHHALAVLTADCLPVLMYHPSGKIWALHAGWQGLVDGMLEVALEEGPTPTWAHVAPSARGCCYHVGPEIIEKLLNTHKRHQYLKGCYWRSKELQESYHLDLYAAARQILQHHGVLSVEGLGYCTVCHPDFFSFRARRDEARMATWIMLNP